jgi:RNA polymerase sigma factor (sigma-70 family)
MSENDRGGWLTGDSNGAPDAGERDWLADRFEEERAHLRAVAYRMLGSLDDADDAVQDAWLRVSRAGADDVANLGGWLTTIIARVCLNMLRSRNIRREESLEVRLPDPIVSPAAESQPEDEALLADSVGLALLVVLDALTPAERLAFVLHDMFGLPFEEIAPVVGRSTAAARQLASRARRRVSGAGLAAPDTDLARQREVVDAFFAAARDGDFDALLKMLHPGVVLRIDAGGLHSAASMEVRGAAAVARQALSGLTSLLGAVRLTHVVVNGTAGVVAYRRDRPITVIGFTIADGKIVEMDSIADPARVRRITASAGLAPAVPGPPGEISRPDSG